MRKIWGSKLHKLLWLGIILVGIAFSTVAAANQYMKPADIRTLIEQARSAWVNLDAEAITQLFTPDGELILPGQRWQGSTKIREEITRFAQQYSDVKIDIRRIIVECDRAAVEWHYEDTQKATGIRTRADDVIIVDFKDGRISRWREYFDTKTPVKNS